MCGLWQIRIISFSKKNVEGVCASISLNLYVFKHNLIHITSFYKLEWATCNFEVDIDTCTRWEHSHTHAVNVSGDASGYASNHPVALGQATPACVCVSKALMHLFQIQSYMFPNDSL